ncbi:hypothetical protein HHK36_033220 [Tetracentron sinense]|uniref:Protein kinase domain-containing protein n=1 Tax=Tetracentron sinense TaxID=13715 RepID=A0A834Y6E5_TETSI|nr:hypothetical protein HHK36_033220 [Tetracentron sinense]
MGACWSARIKAESPVHTGVSSKYVSKDGSDLSGSSSKVSFASVPPTPRSEGEILQSPNLKSFSFGDLKTSTRNFRPDSVLGEGGFGSVFKGWIDEQAFTATKPGTGMVIAVKRLNQEGYQGHKEWLVSIICPLLRILCVLGDLTQLRTFDVLDIWILCHLTAKSDVYSFGVVLLEMLSGRRAVDKNRPSGEHNLVEWAKPYMTNKRKIFRILDTRLDSQYSMSGALKATYLALQCLSSEAKFRPNMDDVVTALEQLQDSKDTERITRNENHPNRDSKSSSGPKHHRNAAETCNRDAASYPRPSASPLYT